RAPARWPAWVAARSAPAKAAREASPALYALPDGSPTLAAAAAEGDRGVLALPAGDLDKSLRRRGDFWVEVTVPEEGEGSDVVSVQVGDRELPLQWSAKGLRSGEAQRFFGAADGASWSERPILWWGEASGPLVDLARGVALPRYAGVTLNATPRMVQRHLLSGSAEVDAAAWAILLALGALLLNVYAVAAIMAVFMIVGLSRAVNRLSRATAAVRRGDFSVRIPAKRRDQIGDLQRSFNLMTANLEALVATSAQKEVLEKELAIARELQQSLIPHDLPSHEGVEFATLFEPSAAIGGDYFDILSLGERQLAVIVADVSGHGLSTGLRMAMLKAALLILIEQERDPEDILRRLDGMVRADPEGRVFVTATLSRVDLAGGRIEIVNAGHPPTYVVRGGRVEEVLLPGSPLGGLGTTYGRRTLELERGDLVVWLSDGLIEAIGPDGTPFGYDRVIAALAGPAPTAAVLRDRLLAAVERHAAGVPTQDDRTLVVMRYGGELAPIAPSPAA
ncbi:MAG TPA: SpoIIE family protein phosphatase, partial [Thermoanaerobaculia bacterium]|nr:SpoIIE family protein phosphatase [Thermoanaerobaculia bacterium]